MASSGNARAKPAKLVASATLNMILLQIGLSRAKPVEKNCAITNTADRTGHIKSIIKGARSGRRDSTISNFG